MKSTARYQLSITDFFIMGGLPGILLIFRSILLALIQRKRDFEAVDVIDNSAVIQIIYAGICFTVGFWHFQKSGISRKIIFNTPLKYLNLYHLLGAISLIWSVQMALSGFRSFECIAYTLIIVSTLSHIYIKKGIGILLKWVLSYALFAIIVSTLGRARLWGLDVFSFQALLAEQMNSTPFFFLAFLLPSNLWIKIIIIPLSFLSLSNTAYVGMGLGAFAISYGSKWLRVLFFSIIIGLTLYLSSFGVNTFLQNTIFYGKEGVGIEYTSGRNIIYRYSWKQIQKKPWTGYGFVAGDTYVINQRYKGAIGAHNGVLSALIGMGYLGGILLVIFFIKILLISRSRKLPPRYRSAFLSTAILIIVHTMGNPGLGTRVYGTWIPAVVIFTTICIVHWHYKKVSQQAITSHQISNTERFNNAIS